MRNQLLKILPLLLTGFFFFCIGGTSYAQSDKDKSRKNKDMQSVSKEFVSDQDCATINVVTGKVDYEVYTRNNSTDKWMRVDSGKNKDDRNPDETDDIKIKQAGSNEMRVVVKAECEKCFTIDFNDCM